MPDREKETTKQPDVLRRKSLYDDWYKENGFSSLEEFHSYIDRGAELVTRIAREAGEATHLEFKGNLFTDPSDPNAQEDTFELKVWDGHYIVSVTNWKNNNYEMGAVDFWLTDIVDKDFPTAPDWDLMGQYRKPMLDRLYKILEMVLGKQLHKAKAIESGPSQPEPKQLE